MVVIKFSAIPYIYNMELADWAKVILFLMNLCGRNYPSEETSAACLRLDCFTLL